MYVFILFAALAILYPAIPAQAASFSVQPSGTCMKVYDAGRQSNTQYGIRFYNSCPDTVYVNACVRDDSGGVKLYKSPSKVPVNGNYTVYTGPNVYPRIVQWTSAVSNPEIPAMCVKANSTSQTFNPRF